MFSLADLCLILFLLAAFVQFLLLSIVFARLAFFKEKISPTETEYPPISLIVCARNELKNLTQNLPLLLQQDYPSDWELLVVDDASEDGSGDFLIQLGAEYASRLRYILLPQKPKPGKKHALEQGILASKHACIALTDADCRPASPNWLKEMALPLKQSTVHRIVLGYAPMIAQKGLLNAWARYEVAHTATLYCGFSLLGLPYMGVGRNMLWEKKLFEQSGGFSEHAHLPSGDDDLFVNQVATRQNVALCLSPESFMYSTAEDQWSKWISQKKRHLSASIAYRFWQQLLLAAIGASWPVFYFFAIVLLFLQKFAWIALILYTLRLILLLFLQARIFRRFQEKSLVAWVPLLDGFMALYYGAFVPLAMVLQGKVKWKENLGT